MEAQPGDLALAARFARACIERSRAEADPRYLGRAQSALRPWWNQSAPPAEALVLRATIKQSLHDFTNALADLDLAVQSAPANAQVWLTRVSVLTLLGRYDEGRRACLPLARLAPGLISMTAAASVASLNGEARHAADILRRTVDASPASAPAEKLWALTALAEISARLGQAPEAQAGFQQALALGRRDIYLLGAYADFLLDQGRAGDAVALLREETRADGLLLRLALAEAQLTPRPAAFASHVAALRARFEASHLRGDTVHQREEARFALVLGREVPDALRLARANWEVQREPADLRILLETALAARDREAAQPALDFMQHHHLEDVRAADLARQLAVLPDAAPATNQTGGLLR